MLKLDMQFKFSFAMKFVNCEERKIYILKGLFMAPSQDHSGRMARTFSSTYSSQEEETNMFIRLHAGSAAGALGQEGLAEVRVPVLPRGPLARAHTVSYGADSSTKLRDHTPIFNPNIPGAQPRSQSPDLNSDSSWVSTQPASQSSQQTVIEAVAPIAAAANPIATTAVATPAGAANAMVIDRAGIPSAPKIVFGCAEKLSVAVFAAVSGQIGKAIGHALATTFLTPEWTATFEMVGYVSGTGIGGHLAVVLVIPYCTLHPMNCMIGAGLFSLATFAYYTASSYSKPNIKVIQDNSQHAVLDLVILCESTYKDPAAIRACVMDGLDPRITAYLRDSTFLWLEDNLATTNQALDSCQQSLYNLDNVPLIEDSYSQCNITS